MLTLGTCRKALWSYGSNVPYTAATLNDLVAFDFKLNQVMERFFTLGTWRSMWKRPVLKVFGNTLTIPRGFDTCRGAESCHGYPLPQYSAFHNFVAYGRTHWLDWNTGYAHHGLTLINEAAQTFVIPTGTFTLRVVGTEAQDPGLSLTGGFDENDQEIFGEINLPIVNGSSDTTQQYVKLPEIKKVVTADPVFLYSVDTTTLEATLIASYAPGETIPSYRQYNVGCGMDGKTVRAMCKLGFEPAIATGDIIIPGHIGALKLGLQALQFEDRVDPANAALYWGPNYPAKTSKMTGAVDLLDAEIEELDAAEQPAFNVSPSFGAGSVINVT